jgi:hypothetical protein
LIEACCINTVRFADGWQGIDVDEGKRLARSISLSIAASTLRPAGDNAA